MESNPAGHDAFRKAVALREESTSRTAELKDDPRLQELKNSKGNITKTAIKKRIKETQESTERNILNEYLASDEAVRDSKADAKRLREEMEKEIGLLLEHDASNEALAELRVLDAWLRLAADESDIKKRLKDAEAAVDAQAYAKYPKLTEAETKTLVVDDKWLAALDAAIRGQMDRVSQQLTQRAKELAERYKTPLPKMVGRVAELEARVGGHLERMGFAWK